MTAPGDIPQLFPPRMFTVRIELLRTTPPIWRQVQVPSDIALDRMHDVIQTSMGWTNSHLHSFMPSEGSGETLPIMTPFDEEEGDEGLREADVRLDHLLAREGDTLDYDYDFGDNWNHRLTLESVTPREAEDRGVRCLAGERNCPPEDVGGVHMYEAVLEVHLGDFYNVVAVEIEQFNWRDAEML